jgi:hypothetical protein
MSWDPVVRCLSSRRLCPLFLRFVRLHQIVSHPREGVRGPRGRHLGLPYGEGLASRSWIRDTPGEPGRDLWGHRGSRTALPSTPLLHLQSSRNSSAIQTGTVTSWGTSVPRVTYVVVKWRHWSSSVTGAVLCHTPTAKCDYAIPDTTLR